jgi:hypothetical protein
MLGRELHDLELSLITEEAYELVSVEKWISNVRNTFWYIVIAFATEAFGTMAHPIRVPACPVSLLSVNIVTLLASCR